MTMREDVRPASSAEDSSARASIVDDPSLDEAGWVRRHLADPARAKESVELYTSLGFEVLSRRLQPRDFGPQCRDCAVTICRSYVLIYTRSKGDRKSPGRTAPTA